MGLGDMSAILSLLGPNGIFWALGAAIIAAMGWGFKQRLTGARLEREKQAREEAKARDVADDVDNDVGALTPIQKRENLKKWAP